MSKSYLNERLIIKTGDITGENCDAIVNAANASLMGGGGVDGAIHRAGGADILAECKRIRSTEYPSGLPAGEAVITTAGNMPAKNVIHTVGPVWKGGNNNEPQTLANCYKNSLALAVQNQIKTIAFPAISTGVYGYPLEKAAAVTSQTIKEFLSSDDSLNKVILIFFSRNDMDIFAQQAQLD